MTYPSASTLNHPIVMESFSIIDREVGCHSLSPEEYAIVRRVIHSTADFEFKHLLTFSPGAIAHGIDSIQKSCPIVVDVNMLRYGIQTLVAKTFGNPICVAVDEAKSTVQSASAPLNSELSTQSARGMQQCLQKEPNAIVAVGNAPTALKALCRAIDEGSASPSLVIGAPVGFVSVLESKAALAAAPTPQIRVNGRKGGSAVAAAIVNALLVMAWENQ